MIALRIIAIGVTLLVAGAAHAQTADQLVQLYLSQNAITANHGDYQTCMPSPNPLIATGDGICVWDVTNLGAQPSVGTLQALIPTWRAQQAALASQASAQAAYNTAVAKGLTVTSTGTPSLSGTYAVDTPAQQALTSEAAYINSTSGWVSDGTFTNGQSTKPWLDLVGAPHSFTVPQFKTLAMAVAQYVDALNTTAATLAAGGTASWPAASATIP